MIVLALRGAAAIAVLTTLVGGVPRLVQLGLAVVLGAWCALVVGGAGGDRISLLAIPRELVIGATLGVLAALPLLAAATAGALVDASGARGRGPYAPLFGVLAAAVFVGIDGHVAVVTAIVESFRALPVAPALPAADASVLAAIGALIPAAVKLAIPWLVTAAVVELAAAAGVRLAGRAGAHVPTAAAAPAALVMMTASLVGVLAVAIAALIRAA
jgi:flagellar biosynthetic protein FliR